MSSMARRRSAKQPWSPWELRRIRGRAAPRDHEGFTPDNYVNNCYSVQVSIVADPRCEHEIVHLWVRRHDGTMPRAWSHLQRIKDEICGADCVGIQVFPRRDDLVDAANLAHLWVWPAGVQPFAFGLHDDCDDDDQAELDGNPPVRVKQCRRCHTPLVGRRRCPACATPAS